MRGIVVVDNQVSRKLQMPHVWWSHSQTFDRERSLSARSLVKPKNAVSCKTFSSPVDYRDVHAYGTLLIALQRRHAYMRLHSAQRYCGSRWPAALQSTPAVHKRSKPVWWARTPNMVAQGQGSTSSGLSLCLHGRPSTQPGLNSAVLC